MSKTHLNLLSAALLLMLSASVSAQHVAAPPAPPATSLSAPPAPAARALPPTPRVATVPPPASAVPHAAEAPLPPSQPVSAGVPPAPFSPQATAAPSTPSVVQAPEPPSAVSMFFNGDNFLGVYTEEVTRENMSRFNLREPRGVGVTRVVKGSPAERAGVRENDVIVRFDGEATTSIRKLNRLIDEAAPEHTARLTILRNGAEQEISVKLGSRRNFGGALSPESVEGLLGQSDDARRQGEQARRRLEELRRNDDGLFSMSFGTGRRIGISTTPLTDQLAQFFGIERGRGVLVSSVSDNSPASRAGLKAGDVVTEVDGERVERASDLTRAINRKKDGDITLTVVRDRKPRTVRLTPERVQTPEMEMFMDAPVVAVSPAARIRLPQITIPRVEVRPPSRVITPQRLRRMNLGSGGTVIL